MRQPVNATERFRHFLDQRLSAELREEGFEGARPDYRIVVTDDLNGDGIPDYIIFNQTAGSCGSGGCSYEIFITRPRGVYENIDENGLFGKSSVFVRQSHGNWKDIYTVDYGTLGSYAVYNRNVYDVRKKAYVEIESRFCGGLDFDVCSSPLLFCTIDANGIDMRSGAMVYRAPYDESVTIAGNNNEAARQPIAAPDELHGIKGQSADGKWFMVGYKFSGTLYARRSDMTGPLPLPRAPCDLE